MIDKTLNQTPAQEKGEQYRNIFDVVADGLIIHDLESGLIVEANPSICRMHGYSREEFIGLPLTTCIESHGQYIFNEALQVFRPDTEFNMQTVDIRRDGSTFYSEWCGAAYSHQDRPCLLSIVRDVSKRVQIEQELSERVEVRTHEQATLLEISHTLASTLELQPGLVLDQLRKIIDYRHGGLFALRDSSLVTLAMRGTQYLEHLAPIQIQLNTPQTLVTLFNGHKPIRIADVWGNDLQAHFLRSLLEDEASILLEDMQSWMWVPLAVRGRIIGGIGIAHEMENYFTMHHADLALSVANQAAITMINAELYEQAQSLAVLEERQRLARSLHDAVNQSLFSAGLIAEVLPRLWDRDQDEARLSLEDVRRLTRGAAAEMRALLAELRPSTLIDSNLGDLLRQLGNALMGRTNFLQVAVTVSGESPLPAEVQLAIYRISQEALNNIAKHAKASKVDINLIQDTTGTELQIRDDGQGFETGQELSGHYGMSMMRERAEAVKALLSVVSKPGQGTTLTIRWTKPPPKESL